MLEPDPGAQYDPEEHVRAAEEPEGQKYPAPQIPLGAVNNKLPQNELASHKMPLDNPVALQ
jgi:hypothetical protein